MQKKTNLCTSSFLKKSSDGTVHYGLDKKNHFTLLSVTPKKKNKKKKKVVFLSSMHSNQSKD